MNECERSRKSLQQILNFNNFNIMDAKTMTDCPGKFAATAAAPAPPSPSIVTLSADWHSDADDPGISHRILVKTFYVRDRMQSIADKVNVQARFCSHPQQ